MKILVTAGPTREPIDAVRFISNRSSGKMGHAIAETAADLGHTVRLISGPVSLTQLNNVETLRINTAAEMLRAVVSSFPWCDALVMTAAVADWRPRRVAANKLKKAEMSDRLDLERTTDILLHLANLKKNQVVVGFAAETANLIKEGKRKLREKNLDLLVANDISQTDAGFEVDTNRVVFVTPAGQVELPLMSKTDVAFRIVKWVESKLAANAVPSAVEEPRESPEG